MADRDQLRWRRQRRARVPAAPPRAARRRDRQYLERLWPARYPAPERVLRVEVRRTRVHRLAAPGARRYRCARDHGPSWGGQDKHRAQRSHALGPARPRAQPGRTRRGIRGPRSDYARAGCRDHPPRGRPREGADPRRPRRLPLRRPGPHHPDTRLPGARRNRSAEADDGPAGGGDSNQTYCRAFGVSRARYGSQEQRTSRELMMSSTDHTHRAATHEVLNQPPPLVDFNAFEADSALREALIREGGEWGLDRVRDFGAVVASSEAQTHARRAQRNIPVLKTHDRFGNRVDEIEYDPSMHWMLRLGVERELNSLPWREPRPGAHVVRAGMFHLFNQLDTGPCCPMSINYAAVPTMRQDARLADEWEARVTLPDYDAFAQAGMVMTEKQGGSDLRANTTIAEPIGDGWFELTGHKWFCTHPVFEVFFTLAQTEAR